MAEIPQNQDKPAATSWWRPEFVLVCIMFIVLTGLVMCVILPDIDCADKDRFNTIIEFRKNTLSILLTAFGAWVGAGAAYFFGRENLKEAANSLLMLHQQTLTGKDRLKAKLVREIPPKLLDWNITEATTIKEVIDKFKSAPERWFITLSIVGGSFDVLNEEAVYRYLEQQLSTGRAYAEVVAEPITKVTEFLKADDKLKAIRSAYITVNMSNNASDVNESMQAKNVFLAIVTDDTGKPTHYFTTNDLRKLLLAL